MKLYKYMNAKVGILTIQNSSIRFTQPAAFNDPFDSYPIVDFDCTDEEFDQILKYVFENKKELVDRLFEKTAFDEYKKIPPFMRQFYSYEKYKEEGLKQIFANSESHYDFFKKHSSYHQIKGLILQTIVFLLGNEIGVLSLSTIGDSLLMWSHYTDAHTGLVIGFDSTSSHFSQFRKSSLDLIKMEYSSKRPEVTFDLREYSREKALQIFKSIFFSKSVYWKYEEEYRLLRELTAESKTNIEDENKFPIHLFSFSPRIISSIILGYRFSRDNLVTILEILNNEKFDHVKLFQIDVDQRKFKLNIKKIKKMAN